MAHTRWLEFLKWALPRMGLAWPGFVRVRRQVLKRIGRRCAALHIGGPEAYRAYLKAHPREWRAMAGCCRISISRFYRDRPVFDFLGETVLPKLARHCREQTLRVWSAGCASGEEPYSVNLLWRRQLTGRFPDVSFHITATDADDHLLSRAVTASYPGGCLRELSVGWRESAFRREEGRFRLCPRYRQDIDFIRQDINQEAPVGPFYVILCRNLAFTYFDERHRKQTLGRLMNALKPGGALIIGKKEKLPENGDKLEPWNMALGVYRNPKTS